MDREEVIKRLKELRSGNWWAFEDPNEIDITNEALDMAIEALSAEQKEEELANDIARRMATIIKNEQDMRVILKNASAELLDDGTLKVNVKNGAEVNRVLVWGDDGCGGLYYADDRQSGEWEYSEDFEDDVVYTCTNCGEPWVLIDGTPQENNMNYCPNCGAKMGSD